MQQISKASKFFCVIVVRNELHPSHVSQVASVRPLFDSKGDSEYLHSNCWTLWTLILRISIISPCVY